MIAEIARHAVAQHCLFGGEIEVHVREPWLRVVVERSESEDGFRQDVALDLVRAAEDRRLAHVEIGVGDADCARHGDRVGSRACAVARMTRSEACDPSASSASSLSRCWISVPLILSMRLDAGPLPALSAARIRSSVYSRAVSSISTSVILRLKMVVGKRRPASPIAAASLRSLPRATFERATARCRCARARAGSWRRSSPCSPRRCVLDRHLTFSSQTSLTSWAPSSVMIGRTVTPGLFMSISRKLMPACLAPTDPCGPGRSPSRRAGPASSRSSGR